MTELKGWLLEQRRFPLSSSPSCRLLLFSLFRPVLLVFAGENPKGNKEIWESRERCRLLSLRKSEVGGQGQRSNRQAQKYNSQSCNPRMNERVREFSFPRLSSSWRCYTVVAGESVTGARILREILWWRARPAQRFLTQRLDNNSFERVVSARLMVYERKRKG